MVISFTNSIALGVTGKLLTIVYKSQNGQPIGAPVAYQQFDPPHAAPRRISFDGLEPIPYIVNTYETSGYPELGSLLTSWLYNPEFSSLDIKVLSLRMVEGDDVYDVPDVPATDLYSWDGYRVLTINRRGFGNLELPVYNAAGVLLNADTMEADVRDSPDDDPKGFTLTELSEPFGDSERFEVTLISRLSTRIPVYNIAKVIYDERFITNDASVTASDSNKAIHLRGDTGVGAFTVTLPLLSSLTPFAVLLPFFSDGGAHINVSLQCSGSDKITIYNPANNSNQRAVVHLGQSEQFWLTNSATEWIVVHNGAPGILNVGKFVETYDKTFVNEYFADGTTALRNIYRRIWERIGSFESGILVTDTVWNNATNNKALYSSGDGVTTFRFPQLYSTGFARAVDGNTRKAGIFQDWAEPDHLHYMFTATQSNAHVPVDSTYAVVVRNGNSGGNSYYDMRGRTKTDGIRADIGETSAPYFLRNGLYVKDATPATEVKPKDYGVYKSIII